MFWCRNGKNCIILWCATESCDILCKNGASWFSVLSVEYLENQKYIYYKCWLCFIGGILSLRPRYHQPFKFRKKYFFRNNFYPSDNSDSSQVRSFTSDFSHNFHPGHRFHLYMPRAVFYRSNLLKSIFALYESRSSSIESYITFV